MNAGGCLLTAILMITLSVVYFEVHGSNEFYEQLATMEATEWIVPIVVTGVLCYIEWLYVWIPLSNGHRLL